MTKRHSCLNAYILYIILYIVYFMAIGKLIAIFLPDLQTDATLAVVLGVSAILSIITVLIIKKRQSILLFIKRWR
jgi:hypothetical protein